ncbi:MAG: hypothetical protein FWD98_03440 [Defluviitaleaceae bacterium]|nr:hypothetical protein [Defluviitaleaceae bacterium]
MLRVVTDIYEQEFKQAYTGLGARGKRGLLKYFFSFYRRWQSGAIIDSTYLTPNNIIWLITKGYHKKTFTTTIPTIKSFKRFEKFEFREVSYTRDAHPVTQDLAVMLSCLSPSFDLVDNVNMASCFRGERVSGYVDDRAEEELMGKLSLQDPFYILYLLRLADEMGLIARMPSLYSNKIQLTPRGFKIAEGTASKAERRKLFGEIADMSIFMAADAIDSFLPTSGIITPGHVYDMLCKPTSFDEIFRYIYTEVGLDFDSVTQIDLSKPVPDELQDIISGTFALGTIISIHMITVFGTYLRFINPINISGCNMERDMAFVRDAVEAQHDIEIPLFSPCTFFSPTVLGLQFFKLSTAAMMKLPATPSLDQLLELISNLDDLSEAEFLQQQEDEHGKHVPMYKLMIKPAAAPKFWKRVAVSGDMTLDMFASFIVFEFFEHYAETYSFQNSDDINRFTEVAPSTGRGKRARRDKDTQTMTLGEFMTTSRKDFLMIVRGHAVSAEMAGLPGSKHKKGEPVRLAITLESEDGVGSGFYPQTVGQGKAWDYYYFS